jgi:UDP-N-acetyl-D-mannosaminuronate dehydrogenase
VKIGIIGMGHVGMTMHALLDPYAQLVTYDPAHDDKYPHDELAECDFAMVCVDTPTGPRGECDVTHVRAPSPAFPLPGS